MLWVEESDSHSLDSRRQNEKETSVRVWTRYNTESGCDVQAAKSVVACVIIIQTDVNGVYHRPSRPISQQHTLESRPAIRSVEMQASVFNSGGRCGGERRRNVSVREAVFNIIPYKQHTGSRDMRKGTRTSAVNAGKLKVST